MNRYKLPIPVMVNDRIYPEVVIKKPKPRILSEANTKIQNHETFSAYTHVLAGGVKCFIDKGGNETAEVNNLCHNMAWRSAEYIMLKIMQLINNANQMSIFYQCNICQHEHIPGVPGNPIKNIDDIEVNEMDAPIASFTVPLSNPIIIENSKKEITQEITSLTFAWPTLSRCITASAKMPTEGLDFQIRTECITAVNGEPIDNKWRGSWGYFVITEMDLDDLQAISQEFSRYGLTRSETRYCARCHQPNEVDYNYQGFFSRGMRNQSSI